MLFAVEVVVVEMEEHFGAGGGGDARADNALDGWEAREEFRGLRVRCRLSGGEMGLIEECGVQCATGSRGRGEGRGE